MAQKRMIDKSIIDSDAFLDMSLSCQALYFHLHMRADDDGFVDSVKNIMRLIGAKEDDLKILIYKKFIIPFESGIIVMKHWRLHNYIAKDRYTETKYKEEKAMLIVDENKVYEYINNAPSTTCIQNVDNLSTQYSKDKNSKDKNSKESGRFTPPTVEEVKKYCEERNNGIDPQMFIDFYKSKGWMIGKNKMKDWQSCVRTWEQKRKQSNTQEERWETLE